MKRRMHSRRPVVEQFESRNLLSAGVTGLHAPAAVSAQPIQLIVPLDGTFRGQFTETERGLVAVFSFSGRGNVRRIGEFSLNGTIDAGGPVIVKVGGTFVLKGAAGSITVELTAAHNTTVPSAGPPIHYTYKIIHGTGMYTNAVDHGTATLTASATGGAPGRQHGHFELVMTSAFPEPASK
jgi:hypothetical protein